MEKKRKLERELTLFDVEFDGNAPLCNPNRIFEYFFMKTRHTTYAIFDCFSGFSDKIKKIR